MQKGHYSSLRWVKPVIPTGLHFDAFDAAVIQAGIPRAPSPDDQSPVKEARFLLRAAAEIEHGLLAQYLYGAYSLKAPQLTAMQTKIISIAREEMGHLLCVQNLLLAIGSGGYFDRENYPLAPVLSSLYPFPLTLEPLSQNSLAKYVTTESPPLELIKDATLKAKVPPIFERADQAAHMAINHVGMLYVALYWLLKSDDTPPSEWTDYPFEIVGATYPANWHLADTDFIKQADLDDVQAVAGEKAWRGKENGPLYVRGVLFDAGKPNRNYSLATIFNIAQQGEGPTDQDQSHFRRFLALYDEFAAYMESDQPAPTWDVPVGPSTVDPGGPTPSNLITNREALLWAKLFNVRYQIILLELSLIMSRRKSQDQGHLTDRTALIKQVVGTEMPEYLSTLGLQLVKLRRQGTSADGPSTAKAGPPFELPRGALPDREWAQWEALSKLILDWQELCRQIKALPVDPDNPSDRSFIDTFAQPETNPDKELLIAIDTILKTTSTIVPPVFMSQPPTSGQPQPTAQPPTRLENRTMTLTYEIHPAIGIARVGTSDDFLIGPEPDNAPPSAYRDGAGQLKRQAVRFRVFECQRNDQGLLTAAVEVTPDIAQITWEVHLVNRKAAAPCFLKPNSSEPNTDPNVRRNNATGNDQALPDRDLIIDPGSQTRTGASQEPVFFNSGQFKGTKVPLGEIRTDERGRLIVIGGFGVSGSNPDMPISSFADNNNWHDDTSDGPVQATLLFPDGRTVSAKPAWVIACQPDFAPGVANLVTLYDLLFDLGVTRGLLQPPAQVAFDKDVWPILQRVLGYQWVNRFARTSHGPGGAADFTAPQWRDLSNPARGGAKRKRLFRLLRNPAAGDPAPEDPAMPRLFSDGYPNDPLPLPLTRVQYQMLQAWSNDQFVAIAPAGGPSELLPDALTRVALQACAGGAFYPGIEAGRRLRIASIYMNAEPFRLSHDAIKPGEVTQSMALPWQADFFACQWEGVDETGHAWWPAQRPDDVLMEQPPHISKAWVRGVHNMHEMVRDWDKLGIVVQRNDPDGTVVFVETERDPQGVLGNQ